MTNKLRINPIKNLKHVVGRYNFVIFVVIVSLTLIGSVTILTATLTQPKNNITNGSSNFDQATMDRLSGLETSTNNSNYNNLPSGRINPFFE